MSSARSATSLTLHLAWPASLAWLTAIALPSVMLVALAIRVAALWTQPHVVFFDETFQYFEQAHRLAFGSGVVPWEFHDGVRSWLLPGLIAVIMRGTDWFTADPLAYVRLTRLLCVGASLSVVLVGYRVATRRDGVAAAILTGGLCAVWFDLVWFSPAVLTEVLAAHAALLALWLGETSEAEDHRRLLFSGAGIGLAFCLRYQYAPALLAAALWQHRLAWMQWRWVAAGGLAVVLAVAGGLDWATWGSPFQSIWLNFLRNSSQGISAAMGTESWSYFPTYLAVSFWPAPILLTLACIGAIRAPTLGITAAVTLIEHSLVPHKEVRFIYLTLAVAPILIGLGGSTVLRALAERCGSWIIVPGTAALLAFGAGLSWHLATSPPFIARWQFLRANLASFQAAHDQPGLCGLAVRDMRFLESGGYSYLHRDVPLYFADFSPALVLPNTQMVLRLEVIRNGSRVPQFPGALLAAEAGRYNGMIAEQGKAPRAFSPVACFDDVTRGARPPLCLFVRPGGCAR